MSTIIDVFVRIAATLLWIDVVVAALRHATRLRTLGWLGTLATAMTLKIDVIGVLVDTVTGRLAVSVLLSNVLLAAASTTFVADALHGARRPHQARVVLLGGVLALVSMCLSWVAGSIAGPATVVPQGLSPAMLARPGIAVSLLIFYALMLALATTFMLTVCRAVARWAPREPQRRVTGQTVLAGAAGAWAATGCALTAIASLYGRAVAGTTAVPDALLTMLACVVLLVGLRAALRRRRDDPAQRDMQVFELHQWLTERTRFRSGAAPAPGDLFVAVVEIRDRIWNLQRWVSPAECEAAVRQARHLGLHGPDARAFALAVCLEIAIAGVLAGDPQEVDSADLSALGGAATPEREIAWLARVQRARLAHRSGPAAHELLTGTTDRRPQSSSAFGDRPRRASVT